MENLDYLIRSLTYKRSGLELDLKTKEFSKLERNEAIGEISGIQYALNLIYDLLPKTLEN
jgi:hypothetical protein